MEQTNKKKVIVVTDGDQVAHKTIQVACHNLGLRFISLSAGNPTPLTPVEAVSLIMQVKTEPVVIMVDDKGKSGVGKGEKVLKFLAVNPLIDILGVVAVASNTPDTAGIKVNCSVTYAGQLFAGSVDKEGFPEPVSHQFLEGDTVDVLNELKIPVVVGIGDIGKMNGNDDIKKGAPNTTLAIKEILQRSGYLNGNC